MELLIKIIALIFGTIIVVISISLLRLLYSLIKQIIINLRKLIKLKIDDENKLKELFQRYKWWYNNIWNPKLTRTIEVQHIYEKVDLLIIYLSNSYLRKFETSKFINFKKNENFFEIIFFSSKEHHEFLNLVKFDKFCKLSIISDEYAIDLSKIAKFFYLDIIGYTGLNSYPSNTWIRIRYVKNPYESVKSLAYLYKSLQPLEREIYDLFGIIFENNKDLKRILNDYGLKGFPLLKHFPSVGYYEIRYDETTNLIKTNRILLDQEFRDFTFENPWN